MKHQPRDYIWIEKYLLATGSLRYYVEDQQRQAAACDAPLNVIHYSGATERWHTTDDIKSGALRSLLGLPPQPPEPSSYEGLVAFDETKAPPGFRSLDPETEDITNEKRAQFAARGLAAYASYKNQESEDIEATVQDFLTDLRHFCDGHGYDFEWICERGLSNYEHERDPSRFGKDAG